MSTKKFRTGPVGALMDEYERAASEYKTILKSVDQETFIKTLDSESKDPDCRSIQTIALHVVNAACTYAIYINKQFKVSEKRIEYYEAVSNPGNACDALDKVLDYTASILEPLGNISEKEVISNIIKARWGQDYDLEQLLEHAIVHILRHRRQIEKLLTGN